MCNNNQTLHHLYPAARWQQRLFIVVVSSVLAQSSLGFTRRYAFKNHASSTKRCNGMPLLKFRHVQHQGHGASSLLVPMKNNLLNSIGDMLMGDGGKLIPQEISNLPYQPPLCSSQSVGPSEDARSFAIRERGISFTGEDFDVYCADTQTPVVRVRGAMLHLPGKDKMKLSSSGDGGASFGEVAVLDRKLISMTPTYEIFRGGQDSAKIGWIEKEVVAMTDTFNVYMEGKGGFGPFRPPPSYRITGDFLDRNFVMRNNKDETVAKVMKDGFFQFDAFNHYQVQVAPGMDAILVIACACAIDEEFDEERRAERMQES